MFWRDEPPVKKEAKVKPKRTPPDPVWLAPDYLPNLQEAWAHDFNFFTDEELIAHAKVPDKFYFDIEVYENYFLAGFRSLKTGKILMFEIFEDRRLDIQKLSWVLENYTIIGFNSTNFDIPITLLALAGANCADLKDATRRIIEWGENSREVVAEIAKRCKLTLPKLKIDHIDLIEVAPLRASLKIYAARLFCEQMQDLPFHPDARLTEDHVAIVRWYWTKDLVNTHVLDEALDEQIKLRESLGKQYGMDLRSKSDAQIAEHVISSEVSALTGKRAVRPQIPAGTVYRYKTPAYMRFESPLLQGVLRVVQDALFIVADHGSIEMPREISELKIPIMQSTYQMGIGGLHSTESKTSHVADKNFRIFDFDVTSYYPWIILNQGLYPYHLGTAFLQVYRRIVDMRLAAKNRGDKVAANGLKIVVNGSYGKLGSKWSNLYAPDLLTQVTMTGQLTLLLLIERFEMAGIRVVSANTDGIVVKPHVSQIDTMHAIVKQWEIDTRFNMESTEYSALYSRDVNSYIAVKIPDKDGKIKTKTKGAYANPWSDSSDKSMWLHKNPTNTICVEAIEALLTQGKPVVTTIMECQDVRKFVSVRTVKGGAVKDGEYLGKSVRWYYAKDVTGEMVYASSGNKVPRSDGARPMMNLVSQIPEDLDRDWYIAEAEKMLREIAYC